MDQQRFWELVSLKLSGEAADEELLELDRLKQQYPETALKLDIIFGIWKENSPPREPALSFSAHLARLKQAEVLPEEIQPAGEQAPVMLPVAKIKKRWFYYLAAAGSVIIFFLGWIYFYNGTHHIEGKNKVANIIATQRGSRTTVQLSDGTKVWLNADSKIYYDEAFKSNVREVQLEGEAFFDVKKDSSRPFIIHTSVIDIKVLGTRFNVKSYKNENETETALISGRVEISIKGSPEKKIILRPNEKLIVKHPASSGTVESGNALLVVKALRKNPVYKSNPEILWMDNKLVFDGETLEAVCKKLERWYNVKITIQDESLKKGAYTAIFDGETLENVLTALKITDGIDFSIHNNEVLIFTKK
ncbi:MAG: FecR family protein [Sphingobacteriales bacterium]|nr:FecR family protein [Sphingobacteriales bacterium]OJY87387.1 MAG: hypothetical protein BGP14_08560 [Sphingobacteriales bacterium 44-15]